MANACLRPHFVGLVTNKAWRYFEPEDFRYWVRTVDLRQSKRYRLRAAVKFSWHAKGSTKLGGGYTRDISPSGVFVVTSERLPGGAEVQLEVALPSLRGERSGACLRTHGHVVRSEQPGFAAAAEMGFRMRFQEAGSSERSPIKSNGNSDGEPSNQEAGSLLALISRFSM